MPFISTEITDEFEAAPLRHTAKDFGGSWVLQGPLPEHQTQQEEENPVERALPYRKRRREESEDSDDSKSGDEEVAGLPPVPAPLPPAKRKLNSNPKRDDENAVNLVTTVFKLICEESDSIAALKNPFVVVTLPLGMCIWPKEDGEATLRKIVEGRSLKHLRMILQVMQSIGAVVADKLDKEIAKVDPDTECVACSEPTRCTVHSSVLFQNRGLISTLKACEVLRIMITSRVCKSCGDADK